MKRKSFFDRDEPAEDDIDIYSDEVRETMLENDELDAAEEAFMNGYDNALG